MKPRFEPKTSEELTEQLEKLDSKILKAEKAINELFLRTDKMRRTFPTMQKQIDEIKRTLLNIEAAKN
jgi:peptidoglycan hydrolase CwlO-like protein